MKGWAVSIIDALLPAECEVCGCPLVDGETVICLHCEADMPRLEIRDFRDNPIHEKLASSHPFERAATLFSYRKGSPYTSIILNAKYNNRPYIASQLGCRLAVNLMPRGFFDGIDAIIPVPMHWLKAARRGYNQSVLMAKSISKITGIPLKNVLGARHHSTQTRKNALRRHENAKGVYTLKKRERLDGLNHVVLVDDVITTGATLLECADAIRADFPDMKISALSAAVTEL